MLKVDNKEIIKKVSIRSLKQNITTNRIVVLAVILMTFMFTTVFTIGISIAQNMNTMLIRQEGNIARTIISHPTDDVIGQVKKCSALYHAGISVNAGQAKPISGEDFTINLIYNDEENYKYNLKPALSDIHGTYPKKIDEIMMSKNGLNELGIKDPKVGDKISLIMKLSITLDTFPTRIMKRSVRRQPLRRIFAALQQGEAHQWTSRSCGCSSNS